MAKQTINETIEIPEGIKIEKEKNRFTVIAAKGKILKTFNSPLVEITVESDKLNITAKKASKKNKAILKTYAAHLKNMFKGVQEGYVYKLKICSGHFPMNLSFNKGILSIKNFLGENIPRTVKISPEVTLKIDGNNITLEGNDKELVGQTAANIEQLTRRPGFDKRIFQDGIFIVSKAGKEI
ncbi:50S ribosomal protein L6 [Candidatus Woesearchaeota archaeon]|nr:50S ribosomal protein L6 [Candidatus Woesearchaeota archaeon]